MTDREAIRRLASMVAVLSGRVVCWAVEERAAALENELLAEPAAPPKAQFHPQKITCCSCGWVNEAPYHYFEPETPAPTVTREQAERVIRILERMPPDQRMAMPKDWPAFFRAVADALEGE